MIPSGCLIIGPGRTDTADTVMAGLPNESLDEARERAERVMRCMFEVVNVSWAARHTLSRATMPSIMDIEALKADLKTVTDGKLNTNDVKAIQRMAKTVPLMVVALLSLVLSVLAQFGITIPEAEETAGAVEVEEETPTPTKKENEDGEFEIKTDPGD